MKSLADTTRNNTLKQKLKADNCYSYTRVTYIDDNSARQEFYDCKYPINIRKRGEPPKFANTNFNPAVAECDFTVLNETGKYSRKNTGSALKDILKRDRVFEFWDGKWIEPYYSTSTETITLSGAITFFTFYNAGGGYIELSGTNIDGNTCDYMNGIFHKYDEYLYNETTYSPEGYAVFDAFEAFDYGYIGKIRSISITANDTNVRVYIRGANNLDELESGRDNGSWRYVGNSINGTTSITVDLVSLRYLQVGLVFATGDWDSNVQVSALSVVLDQYVEWVKLGTFYLDDPEFEDKQSPQLSDVRCRGRNAYKKLLETEINIKNLSGAGGTNIDDLIKDICDQGNITYTGSSIADLSAFGARTFDGGYDETVKADDIILDIMLIIGHTYRMYIDDNDTIYVTAISTGTVTVWTHNYLRYLNANQKDLTTKQLQKFRVQNKQIPLRETEQIDSGTIVAAGDTTFNSWTGNYIAKYITAVDGGTNVDGVVTAIEMENDEVIVTVTGSTVDLDIVVYGCGFKGKIEQKAYTAGSGKNDLTISGDYIGGEFRNYKIEIDGAGSPDTFRWSNDGGSTWEASTVSITGDIQDLEDGIKVKFANTTGHDAVAPVDTWEFITTVVEPEYMGEGADATNLLNNDGARISQINPLVISSDECKTISENQISSFGTPEFDIEILDFVLNPLPEINDLNTWVSEDLFSNAIYELKGIDYIINSETEKKSTFYLEDTGRKITSFKWDTSIFNRTGVLTWDSGIVWDAAHAIGSTREQILATNPLVYNVDCS